MGLSAALAKGEQGRACGRGQEGAQADQQWRQRGRRPDQAHPQQKEQQRQRRRQQTEQPCHGRCAAELSCHVINAWADGALMTSAFAWSMP